MSLFLGPIHYWLYNKIGNQERLTERVAIFAKAKGLIQSEDIYTKELQDLETVIDESNIHGWLQAQIADAEIRYAKLLADIMKAGVDIAEVKETAYEFGRENAVDSESDAAEIYKYFEDFFVNGMPCDHVNIVTDKSENRLDWEMLQDIHKQYFSDIVADYYYELRKEIMDGMLYETEYVVEMSDVYHYTIRKK